MTENGHALFANFITGSTTNWGGLTTSDAGTAWWQERNGEWQRVSRLRLRQRGGLAAAE